jgi:hypothetical protein
MRRNQQAFIAALLGLVAAAPAAGGGGPALRATGTGGTLERAGAEAVAPNPFALRALAAPFTDPAGDQNGDPLTGDITLTDVTDTPTHVTFSVDIPNAPTLRTNDVYELLLDTDRNAATGDSTALGAEILVQIDGSVPGYAIGRWSGTGYAVIPDTATVQWNAGPLITVNRGELGITDPGFNFVSDSIYLTGGPPPTTLSGVDLAPDGGTYAYTLVTRAPLPPAQDMRPPNTTITLGVSGATARRSASFRFRSSERASTFGCKLDRRPWARCRSPRTYRNLRPGRHTFQVRARDAAGNVDPTPARRIWTVRRS